MYATEDLRRMISFEFDLFKFDYITKEPLYWQQCPTSFFYEAVIQINIILLEPEMPKTHASDCEV